jgi:hypothetical protein
LQILSNIFLVVNSQLIYKLLIVVNNSKTFHLADSNTKALQLILFSTKDFKKIFLRFLNSVLTDKNSLTYTKKYIFLTQEMYFLGVVSEFLVVEQ